MKILIACEESQAVCLAFRDIGFEAYSCDIQPRSGGRPEWHIQGDAIAEAYSGKYDLLIAHPPCTYLSRAGACRMYPRAGVICSDRFAKAMEAKTFFLALIDAPVKYIAIENPLPLRVVNLPIHTQVIQPYEYGHPFSKRTHLWLKGLPKLTPTSIIKQYKPYLPSNTGGKKRGQKYMFKSISQKESSKTFPGIARAMAQQWGAYLLNPVPTGQLSLI